MRKSDLIHKVVAMCADIVHARCNNNIKQEQRHYENLRAFCEKHNIDFTSALREGCRVAVNKSVSLQMRGAKAVIE